MDAGKHPAMFGLSVSALWRPNFFMRGTPIPALHVCALLLPAFLHRPLLLMNKCRSQCVPLQGAPDPRVCLLTMPMPLLPKCAPMQAPRCLACTLPNPLHTISMNAHRLPGHKCPCRGTRAWPGMPPAPRHYMTVWRARGTCCASAAASTLHAALLRWPLRCHLSRPPRIRT